MKEGLTRLLSYSDEGKTASGKRASWCDLGALDVAIGCSGRLKEELVSCGALLMEAMDVAVGFRPLLEGDADEG
ncbi:hypothetical protein ACLOJK_023134 [Asimina triloba]